MSTKREVKEKDQVVIVFAGDSGDGMQFTGNQFTNTSAQIGNDISTFPDFPAEIRAPQGTLSGVSGFQLHFGSVDITSPGDACDVLVAMNAAALKKNYDKLKPNGILIANESGFDAKNLKLANAENEDLIQKAKAQFKVYSIDITKLTKEALKDFSIGTKDKDRAKNMFALGFVYWLYNRPLDFTINYIEKKFKKYPEIINANIHVLKAGYHFGEITDTFTERFLVRPAKMPKGEYRNITGNEAVALGAIAASKKAQLSLFYGGYPITPASDVLHFLSKYKSEGVKTFQAEDEIAAISAVIGASFGGDLAITASSGPGISLKLEAMGLGMMLELPMVILNVQRGGPSTGLPTKTEQSDLLQALYGRNGEAPIPVVAAKSPIDCFAMMFEACKIAIEHMTPVILLSDGYLANGSEPWKFPTENELPLINSQRDFKVDDNGILLPYARNNDGVRAWVLPGMEGLEHRVGGLEKENVTGNVSYAPKNHELMVKLRQEKVNSIQNHIPNLQIEYSSSKAKTLILGWGSTYGSIVSATKRLIKEGYEVANAHLQYIYPFPKNTKEILNDYEHIVIPELNQGQLVKLIREQFLVDAKSLTKTQGIPFTSNEIEEYVKEVLLKKEEI